MRNEIVDQNDLDSQIVHVDAPETTCHLPTKPSMSPANSSARKRRAPLSERQSKPARKRGERQASSIPPSKVKMPDASIQSASDGGERSTAQTLSAKAERKAISRLTSRSNVPSDSIPVKTGRRAIRALSSRGCLPGDSIPVKSGRKTNTEVSSIQGVSSESVPSKGGRQAKQLAPSSIRLPGETSSRKRGARQTIILSAPKRHMSDGQEIPARDHLTNVTHQRVVAGRNTNSSEDQRFGDFHSKGVDARSDGDLGCVVIQHQIISIGLIRELHRDRQGFHRAEKALTLQIKSVCRRMSAGDKTLGQALAAAVEKNDPAAASTIARVFPFIQARELIRIQRKAREKEMVKAARTLAAFPFVAAARGFGELGFAQIIGECGDLSLYSNPAKVWKRMGLAVVNGKSQRKMSGMDGIEQGYSPVRRSIMWNIGDCIVKSGKGGEYRAFYDSEKIKEQEKARAAGLTVAPSAKIPKKRAAEFISELHIHRRAQRKVEKRLLRDLWRFWRDAGEMN